VHPNAEGHALMADVLIAGLVPGDVPWWQHLRKEMTTNPKAGEAQSLIHQQVHLLGSAWLSDVGHKRPGVSPGLPLQEAEARSGELETKIRATVADAHLK
jgi:hypothetical protein